MIFFWINLLIFSSISFLFIFKQGDYSHTYGTNFKPVCGSDGETYSNFAMLKAYTCVDGTKVTKAHDGPCGN